MLIFGIGKVVAHSSDWHLISASINNVIELTFKRKTYKLKCAHNITVVVSVILTVSFVNKIRVTMWMCFLW